MKRPPFDRPALLAWLALLVCVIVLLATRSLWLSLIGEQLVAADPLEPADVIIVLAGSSPVRLRHGLDLYRAGYAPRLLISDEEVRTHGLETTWGALYRAGLADLPAPPEDVDLLSPSNSTYEEALKSRDLMRQRSYRSAILVTDAFHSRRAIMTFNHVFGPAGLVVRVSPSHYAGKDVTRWWEDEEKTTTVAMEYLKFVYYAIRGRLF